MHSGPFPYMAHKTELGYLDALKQNLDILMPALTSIVNNSLLNGTFPTALKEAMVTLLLTKPTWDKDTLNNYRPVFKK